jgi:hypothetical protein
VTETLLSPSNILLFGRTVTDLAVTRMSVVPRAWDAAVDLALTTPVVVANPLPSPQQGVDIQRGMRILLTAQAAAAENGIYRVVRGLNLIRLANQPNVPDDIFVRSGADLIRGTIFTLTAANTYTQNAGVDDDRHGPFPIPRGGTMGQVEQQLSSARGPRFARIYGFSYEGTYYDLPRPVLFLVHGEGAEASEMRMGTGRRSASRAPADPSLTGLVAADFEFADDVRVWSYDKADYTIRMDVDTGMFEQVLLALFFGDDTFGTRLAGAKVSGAKVSGAKVSGAKVSGAKLSGRWDPSD